MTFNIIFTPNTVSTLSIFTLSLLKRTKIKYRLVANACTKGEVDILKRISNHYDRLEVLDLANDKMIWQYEVLNYLLENYNEEFFCIMDSDIFATADFMRQFQPFLDSYSAIYSCAPLWTDNFYFRNHMAGRFIKTKSGFELGCTFFAIYNKNNLNQFLSNRNIDFRKYSWDENGRHPIVPIEFKQRMESEGLKSKGYDTGKILNITFQLSGHSARYIPSEDLYHIGGISMYLSKEERRPLNESIGLINNKMIPVKEQSASYFAELLENFVQNRPLPPSPLDGSNNQLSFLEKQVKIFMSENKDEIKNLLYAC